jgi:hypothetical protein
MMRPEQLALANLTLDAIHAENLEPFATKEPAAPRTKAAVHPVRGEAYYQGAPMAGAVVTLTPDAKLKKGVAARGIVQPDGSFALTTYQADDGAAEGEYAVTVAWREKLRNGKVGANLLPERFGKTDQSGLRATIRAGQNELILELKK